MLEELVLELLLPGEEGVLAAFRRPVAHLAAVLEGAQVVEEVLQLVHLGVGKDAVEGDGTAGAAVRAVRGEVQGVSPVPTEKGKRKEFFPIYH